MFRLSSDVVAVALRLLKDSKDSEMPLGYHTIYFSTVVKDLMQSQSSDVKMHLHPPRLLCKQIIASPWVYTLPKGHLFVAFAL
jgi:hypothetical protein